ncbi:acetolactate synthase large subunit [Noviherbaspirillum pedocola]|uniref:Acetolactate synthase large subunit n=1 Tax=Noviherbaspirillum pedocola TaxID=2801341 RepID=A0A934SXU9_9BURK|nr:acetolactate synthase large subunit [Noviherbaspirillum pedocola]MBK4738540.1 acetolactate synthase large subunit [Noviherbaspirillum pedocola]
MNGAESLVRTLLANEINLCFANPGTSEMHFIAALDKVKGMRCVLGLFEGVVTGAADGYYRMTGKPASTLLHLAPGLANGLSNLHNARKARSGIVNIVGQHATYHLQYDAPLSGDIEGVAMPMSHWVRTATSSQTVATDGAAAVQVAHGTPGKIATLVLPADVSWGAAQESTPTVLHALPRELQADGLAAIAQALRGGKGTVLLLGGLALRGRALEWAGRIAAKVGCRLMSEGQNARLERGAGRVSLERLPYDVPGAIAALKGVGRVVLAGARMPVAFFAYPDQPSLLTPEACEVLSLAEPDQDIEQALEALAHELGAASASPAVCELRRPALPSGRVTPEGIAAVLGALMPEQAIVVDESISMGRGFFPPTSGAAPHDWMNSMGASLGYALPVAIGAALAAPERKVLALVGDGSAMYTLQALWTMARESLDVTIVILANRSYNILRSELAKVGAGTPGPTALSMLTLDTPNLDWVALAKGHGVAASRAHSLEELARALGRALTDHGPRLVELVI